MYLKNILKVTFFISQSGIILASFTTYYCSDSNSIDILTIAFIIISVISLFILLHIVKKFSLYLKIEDNNSYLEKQLLLKQTYLANIKHLSKRITTIKKQSEQDILLIYEHIAANDLQAAAKEREKIDTIYTNLKLLNYCNHPVINAILYPKCQYCYQNHILVDICLSDLSDTSIDDLSLVCIISNLMDNAIEALSQMPDNMERFIHFNSVKQSGFLLLHFENSKLPSHKVIMNKSSKKNADEHGYGLSIIHTIAQKYDGNFQIQDTLTSVTFTIALHEQKKKIPLKELHKTSLFL